MHLYYGYGVQKLQMVHSIEEEIIYGSTVNTEVDEFSQSYQSTELD